MEQTYLIKLEQFEGPFDLLLFFIERDELDIYDIPIARITQDFLQYIHQMEQMDVELASEFILVAATLMRIKAKMLLPRKEVDEAGEEIDPREELVKRLIEYKRFKEASAAMQDLEGNRMKQIKRGNIDREMREISDSYATTLELHSLTVFKLMTAFQKVLTRLDAKDKEVHHEVKVPTYSIDEQKYFIMEKLGTERTPFEGLFEGCENRHIAIYTFLAMLELVQQGMIRLTPGIGVNNFWVELV